jgi:hypothetical protein
VAVLEIWSQAKSKEQLRIFVEGIRPVCFVDLILTMVIIIPLMERKAENRK